MVQYGMVHGTLKYTMVLVIDDYTIHMSRAADRQIDR